MSLVAISDLAAPPRYQEKDVGQGKFMLAICIIFTFPPVLLVTIDYLSWQTGGSRHREWKGGLPASIIIEVYHHRTTVKPSAKI